LLKGGRIKVTSGFSIVDQMRKALRVLQAGKIIGWRTKALRADGALPRKLRSRPEILGRDDGRRGKFLE
jgi:hypothetical protein